jgi:hypothetical protein
MAVIPAAISSTSQIEMWIPRASCVTPTEPKWNLTCWNWPDANQPAQYAPIA